MSDQSAEKDQDSIELNGASILSSEPGEYFINDDELRQFVCFLSDGRLYVEKSKLINNLVTSYISRVRLIRNKKNLPEAKTLAVELAAITKLQEKKAGSESSSSDTQRLAIDLFRRAVDARASDVHLRVSKRSSATIQFRVHGDLEEIEQMPFEKMDQLCTTIYQSMADVADATFEPNSIQDARIGKKSNLHELLDGIRIATAPIVDGYLMVLRLLYNDAKASSSVVSLGYSLDHEKTIEVLKKSPNGIVIVSGPTGSGKSTSLQRILTKLIEDNGRRINVMTVEDPPEYPIPGANQMPVTNASTSAERSTAYENAIKAAMRLDPDVIMVSEVRDRATAKAAIEAAMTGHQVWTTVHANSGIAIIDRIVDLGVEMSLATDPNIIAGLVSQRLVQTLCKHCCQTFDEAVNEIPEKTAEIYAKIFDLKKARFKGYGCSHCKGSGTTGRTVFSEIIPTDERFMSLLRNHDKVGALNYWKTELNGKSMRDHAIDKINAGLVDPREAEKIVALYTASELITGEIGAQDAVKLDLIEVDLPDQSPTNDMIGLISQEGQLDNTSAEVVSILGSNRPVTQLTGIK